VTEEKFMPTAESQKDEQRSRVALMLEQFGLGSDGRPLAPDPTRFDNWTSRSKSPQREPEMSRLARIAREAQGLAPQSGAKTSLEPYQARSAEVTSFSNRSVLQPIVSHSPSTLEMAQRTIRSSDVPRQMQKRLPDCAQAFLKGRVSGDPADITLYRGGGGIPNWFDNSVTYGDDIHLTDGLFDRRSDKALHDKFHEIHHVSQNARMGLNSFDHFAPYLIFGGHDGSPLEEAAEKFADKTLKAYQRAKLNKTCPF
jgi:hypothetical protein